MLVDVCDAYVHLLALMTSLLHLRSFSKQSHAFNWHSSMDPRDLLQRQQPLFPALNPWRVSRPGVQLQQLNVSWYVSCANDADDLVLRCSNTHAPLSVQTGSVLDGRAGAAVWRYRVPAVGTAMARTHDHEQLHGHSPNQSWTDRRSANLTSPWLPSHSFTVYTTLSDYITCSICLEEVLSLGMLRSLCSFHTIIFRESTSICLPHDGTHK